MLKTSLILFFPFLMIFAAFSDLVSMTISNKVSLALIAGFVCFAWIAAMPLNSFGWHWAMFALVLCTGFVFFAFGWMGGGDVKLAASTALWFGWEHTISYLVIASLLGALLTIFLLNIRGVFLPMRLAQVEWIARLCRSDTGIPYGIALGTAAIMVYPDTQWVGHAVEVALLD